MKIHTSVSVMIRLLLWFVMIGGTVNSISEDRGTQLFDNVYTTVHTNIVSLG